ncbi:MAG: thiopeptide-type bacteriocin biosynthesis protein [Pseudonocardiaceae bacterium]
MASGSGMEKAYRALPAATEGALRAQMSFAPAYPHAENVCRVPAYLPHLLPLGEHRGPGEGTILAVDDLAITATRDRLHLVSISSRRVVEPQVFHALALDKQPPPLARFLAQLPRAFSAAWYEFDWGPHAQLPYLPRVRYRRTVLSSARWRLTTDDLPHGEAGQDQWRQVLDRWRHRWRCPDVVELRDADRILRLILDEPAHAALVHAHLTRHGQAILTEATPATEFGWLDGHAHEIALPLVTTRPAAPSPVRGPLPHVTNTHGHLPGSSEATWLTAKIHTHPERQDEIIAEYLPMLTAALDDTSRCWFVRYRSPNETDHLRPGAAMDAAEEVFVADSHVVSAGLRNLPATAVHPTALVVANMVHIVRGFLGDLADAMAWLAARPAPVAPATDRSVAGQAVRLARRTTLRDLPGWQGEVETAWQARAAALAAYRERLPPDAHVDGVVESLLHMHHNRALGIDPDAERTYRRLARQAALSWRAHQGGDDR